MGYNKIITVSLLLTMLNITQGIRITVYEDVEFQGASRLLLPFKACLDLSNAWDERISSVNTNEGCIILCEKKRCLGRCEKIFPGTNSHNDLRILNLNDKVSSYRNCEAPNDNNIPQ